MRAGFRRQERSLFGFNAGRPFCVKAEARTHGIVLFYQQNHILTIEKNDGLLVLKLVMSLMMIYDGIEPFAARRHHIYKTSCHQSGASLSVYIVFADCVSCLYFSAFMLRVHFCNCHLTCFYVLTAFWLCVHVSMFCVDVFL